MLPDRNEVTAWKLGFHIVEIPISSPTVGGNLQNVGRDLNEALWGVLRMKLRSIFWNY